MEVAKGRGGNKRARKLIDAAAALYVCAYVSNYTI
jgi:hypothetical protein